MSAVGQLVKRKRLAMGLSLESLAVSIGMTRQALHYVESGRSMPTLTTSALLCDALVIDPHELLKEARSDARA